MKLTACQSISPYLLPDSKAIVCPVKMPLFGQKQMLCGNKPTDGDYLKLTASEKEEFCSREPLVVPYVKRMIGSDEMLNGGERWCLWLVDAPKEILELPLVAERVKARRAFLLASRAQATRSYANNAHLFRQIVYPCDCLAVSKFLPDTRRNVVAMKISKDTVVLNSVQLIRDADCIDFSILSSRMHSIWTRFVCGRHEVDVRYSIDLCWNTFPWPKLRDGLKQEFKRISDQIESARTECGMTLSQMYRIDAMPDALKNAHQNLDRLVDVLYNPDGFAADRERLECLLRMYEEKTSRISVDIGQWC